MKDKINGLCSHLLSKAELEKVHKNSLKILSEIGIKIEDEALREKLIKEGCSLGDKNQRVTFPEDLIEEVLGSRSEAEEITIKNPNSGEKISFGNDFPYSHPFGTVPYKYDIESKKPIKTVSDDLVDFIQLQNNLESIDLTGPMILPTDVPSEILEIKICELCLRYTQNPFGGLAVSSSEEIDYIIELFNIVKDKQDESLGTLGISPESPLSYPKEITEIMKKAIYADIPIKVLVGPVAGLTSPFTLAGSLSQMNASMLAFTAIANILSSEVKLIFGSRISFPNMKNANSIWGLSETGLVSTGAVQLARHYDFYTTVYGVSTTSCSIDVQTGYEKAINSLQPSLAGADMISGAGSLASGTLASKEQLIIDNEIISMVKRITKRYNVTSDTLGFEVISQAIEDGDFIAQKHTVDYLRSQEVYYPELGFDSLWSEWESEGFPRMIDKAASKVEEITTNSRKNMLSAHQNQEIDKVLEHAKENL